MKASFLLTLLAVAGTLSVGQAEFDTNELSILIEAVQYAGLAQALPTFKGTILAPINSGFVNLLATLNVTSLDAVPKEVVADVLSYHVLDKKVTSKQLKDGMELTPIGPTEDEIITVSVTGKSVVFEPSSGITPAEVVAADLEIPGIDAVVHAISEVLVPEYVLSML